eukprot:c18089_g1_i1.p1 GENE.c18089_g1_i1~~c18089_g1_i1.p1  ORF type:complete len:346 (+),score=107.68 c18089_g1_i1:63-1040(+)
MSHAGKGQEAMEKYMNPIPAHLANVVEYLNKSEPLPDWEANLLGGIKQTIQQHIKEHFETSATSRQKFVSMSKDVWQDEHGLFKLVETPRKVLGYLPKPELAKLDDLARLPMEAERDRLRADLHSLFERMRASEPDRKEIAPVLARPDTFFVDLEVHHSEVDKWSKLCEIKEPVIKELEQREEFLEEIEEFELKATGDKDRYKKMNSLALADENKFRAYAAKKLKELDARAEQLCVNYEQQTGRPFEVDGINYLNMIKEQKFGRSHNPSLSLAKLRKEAIPASELQKHAGGRGSNLVVDPKVVDTVEQHPESDNRIIRRHSAHKD